MAIIRIKTAQIPFGWVIIRWEDVVRRPFTTTIPKGAVISIRKRIRKIGGKIQSITTPKPSLWR